MEIKLTSINVSGQVAEGSRSPWLQILIICSPYIRYTNHKYYLLYATIICFFSFAFISIPNNSCEKFSTIHFLTKNFVSKFSEGFIFHARNFMDEVDIPFEANM